MKAHRYAIDRCRKSAWPILYRMAQSTRVWISFLGALGLLDQRWIARWISGHLSVIEHYLRCLLVLKVRDVTATPSPSMPDLATGCDRSQIASRQRRHGRKFGLSLASLGYSEDRPEGRAAPRKRNTPYTNFTDRSNSIRTRILLIEDALQRADHHAARMANRLRRLGLYLRRPEPQRPANLMIIAASVPGGLPLAPIDKITPPDTS